NWRETMKKKTEWISCPLFFDAAALAELDKQRGDEPRETYLARLFDAAETHVSADQIRRIADILRKKTEAASAVGKVRRAEVLREVEAKCPGFKRLEYSTVATRPWVRVEFPPTGGDDEKKDGIGVVAYRGVLVEGVSWADVLVQVRATDLRKKATPHW